MEGPQPGGMRSHDRVLVEVGGVAEDTIALIGRTASSSTLVYTDGDDHNCTIFFCFPYFPTAKTFTLSVTRLTRVTSYNVNPIISI